jgi:hypothetical protein
MLLIVEEAIVLVYNLPQGLEITLGCIREFLLVDARRE